VEMEEQQHLQIYVLTFGRVGGGGYGVRKLRGNTPRGRKTGSNHNIRINLVKLYTGYVRDLTIIIYRT
jgi:hypothetical protein